MASGESESKNNLIKVAEKSKTEIKFENSLESLEREQIEYIERLNIQLESPLNRKEEREILRMRESARANLAKLYAGMSKREALVVEDAGS